MHWFCLLNVECYNGAGKSDCFISSDWCGVAQRGWSENRFGGALADANLTASFLQRTGLVELWLMQI
jgi:hypothetical protein